MRREAKRRGDSGRCPPVTCAPGSDGQSPIARGGAPACDRKRRAVRPGTHPTWSARRTLQIILAAAVPGVGACNAEFVARFNTNVNNELASFQDGKACGDGNGLAALIPDCPFEGVCFTSACEAHDSCYVQCQGTRHECDLRFYTNMTGICHDTFTLDDVKLRQCLYSAFAYYAAVDRKGADAYLCDNGPPLLQVGACCTPGAPPVCGDEDAPACPATALFFAGQTCTELDEILGGCPTPPNDNCADAIEVCAGQVADPDAGRCVGETPSEIGDRACRIASQDCLAGESCLPRDGDVYVCTALGDNRLAATDGPDPGVECGFDQPERFRADVWFAYTAPCSGTLSISMCLGTRYDAVLAVYGANDSSGGCSCPDKTNNTLTACDDDSCGGFQTGSVVSIPGVVAGACYTIRVGGWSSDSGEAGTARGFSQIDIGMLCD